MLCVKGKRPEIPKESPSNIKKLIEECWKQDPTKRIRSFQLIHHLIDQDLEPQPQLDSQTIERKIEENKLKDEKEKQQEFDEILSSLTENKKQFINNISFNEIKFKDDGFGRNRKNKIKEKKMTK